jgi:hypothetical protein
MHFVPGEDVDLTLVNKLSTTEPAMRLSGVPSPSDRCADPVLPARR